MQIIDGYTGAPNIYADDIGQYNISLYGNGDYVLPVGEQLGYELVSNNEIKIKDGFFITQGRRGVIKKGTTESCVIENGTQAENRNDLIIIEYVKDESSLVESHTMKVIKGTPGETAADPTTITGNIPNGAVLHQMPLYRVKLEGLNIVAVEPLFTIGKVSPETVDPMLATEEGFAADAKMTGNALKSLNSNLEGVLLWENTSPTTSMGETVITLSDSIANFAKYEIIYKPSTGVTDRFCTTGLLPTDMSAFMFMNGSEGYCRRSARVNGNEKIDITVGAAGATSGDNTICIPYRIYGYGRKS